MLKLTSGFTHDIRESRKLDVGLVDRLSSVDHNGDEDFRVYENGILKFQNRVCVYDVSERKGMILEEGCRTSKKIREHDLAKRNRTLAMMD